VATDVVLLCGDYNLTNVRWSMHGVSAFRMSRQARESIVVDGMDTCDLGRLNPIVNQYDVFLDLVFYNFLGM
jgi:hypothetical protein